LEFGWLDSSRDSDDQAETDSCSAQSEAGGGNLTIEALYKAQEKCQSWRES